MPQPKDDLSRCLVALDQNNTQIAVLELSSSTWLVGGMIPGIELVPDEEALLRPVGGSVGQRRCRPYQDWPVRTGIVAPPRSFLECHPPPVAPTCARLSSRVSPFGPLK
jgi:hypothetical protein